MKSRTWAEIEKAVLRYTEWLILDPGAMTDQEFQDLRRELTDEEIVEIGFTVLAYNGIHRFNVALDLDPIDTERLTVLRAVHEAWERR